MALNIKNAETEKLARELARRRKQGITEALTDVLRREVERERKKPRRGSSEELHRRIEEIVSRSNGFLSSTIVRRTKSSAIMSTAI